MKQYRIENILNNMTILIDTREQEYRHITQYFDRKKISYKRHTLNVGDYSFMLEAERTGLDDDVYFYDNICIERKRNLEELSNNIAQSRERFERELTRGNGKLILLIENANIMDIVNHKYETQLNPKSYLSSLYTFQSRYNLQIEYVKDTKYSGLIIYYKLYYWCREWLNTNMGKNSLKD